MAGHHLHQSLRYVTIDPFLTLGRENPPPLPFDRQNRQPISLNYSTILDLLALLQQYLRSRHKHRVTLFPVIIRRSPISTTPTQFHRKTQATCSALPIQGKVPAPPPLPMAASAISSPPDLPQLLTTNAMPLPAPTTTPRPLFSHTTNPNSAAPPRNHVS